MSTSFRWESADPSTLAESELLALLLGGDTCARRAADHLLESAGSLYDLARSGRGEIAQLLDGGHRLGDRVWASFEIGRRIRAPPPNDVPLTDPDAVANWAHQRLADLEHEELWVVALDASWHVKGARRVAMGGVHGLTLRPADVLRFVVREAASALVLIHNHPTGNPEPSREDVATTLLLARASEVVGLSLVDHVIVARGTHVSLSERGVLSSSRKRKRRHAVPSADQRSA